MPEPIPMHAVPRYHSLEITAQFRAPDSSYHKKKGKLVEIANELGEHYFPLVFHCGSGRLR